MEEKIARLEANQKYNEKELAEVKIKVERLEASYAVISVLSSQVEKLALTIEKLNRRIDKMENKDTERIEIEMRQSKANKSQITLSIIQAIATAFILLKLGLK